jgi:Na+/H+ antiporter NhaD/arsenite permease-like protein
MHSFLNFLAFIYVTTVVYEIIQGTLEVRSMLSDKSDKQQQENNDAIDMHPLRVLIRLLLAVMTVAIVIGTALAWPIVWYLNVRENIKDSK